MTKTKVNLKFVTPVLISFFVMSFIDLVGTGVDELKNTIDIPKIVLQLIPFVAFIWFFFLSIPIGVWQDKVGKQKVLNIGILITAIALLFPIFGNTLPVILISFSLVGIGNVILQVSANPLLVDIVPKDKGASILSFSQAVKSIGSAVGPFVAAFFGPWMAKLVGDTGPGAWRYGLYLFAVISILCWVWLSVVKIDESKNEEANKASFKSCIKLLGNSYVAMMVLVIFLIVGVDVAMNTTIGGFLEEKFGLEADKAKLFKSLYFIAKMVGTFIGGILLLKVSPKKFMIGSAILGIASLVVLGLLPQTSPTISASILIFVVSLSVSNIFPLTFMLTVGKLPERANEISGLMMMAIVGGGIVPFLVDLAIYQVAASAGMLVLAACMLYIFFVSLKATDIKQ